MKKAIDLQDDREYAWLLVRSDTLTAELLKVWNSVPIRAGSAVAAALGYPARFLMAAATVLITVPLMLAILIGAAQIPVAVFAWVHPLLPGTVWLVLLWTLGVVLGGHLAYSVGLWLHRASQTEQPVAPAADTEQGAWNRWQSVHVGHDSARSGLFAGLSLVLGIILQCTAVVLGAEHFAGAVDQAWAWPVLFGEQLFSTMLLGIPGSFLPAFASIEAASATGRLLTVGVDVFYAAGVITLSVMTLSSAFKVRELFNGTVRDLADHLENFDLSGGSRLIIHRVAVLRPLDENEVVTVSKDDFFGLIATTPGRAP